MKGSSLQLDSILKTDPSDMTSPPRDAATVSAEGKVLQPLPHGVEIHPLTTHPDDRGTICELFDPRWSFINSPFTYTYMATLRPGKVKGWALHHDHEDRYVLLFGEMQVMLFDAREDSPTKGLVASVVMSHYHRSMLNIPAGIWHADWNIGTTDAIFVNFPTKAYEHKNPDKYRLPIDTDQIPFKFPDERGW